MRGEVRASSLGLGDHQSAFRRNAVPLGGPADFRGRGSPNTILAPLSLQREDGALRVYAAGDPATARYFNRPLKYPAATGLHALRRRVDVADIEIVKPIWDRLRRSFGEDAADRQSSGGEQLIRVRRTCFGARILPAKKLAVERKGLLPVGGEQLMPAHVPRFIEFGRMLLPRFQTRDQRKRRRL